MIKKEVFTGFLIGVLANGIGIVLYVLFFSEFGIVETLGMAYREGFLGSLVALGAILNLVAFFWFIRQRNDYRAKGVLTATIIVALLLLFYKMSL